MNATIRVKKINKEIKNCTVKTVFIQKFNFFKSVNLHIYKFRMHNISALADISVFFIVISSDEFFIFFPNSHNFSQVTDIPILFC